MNATVTTLTYRAFYSQEGQLVGVHLDESEIAWAMQMLPSDLEHRLPSHCSLSVTSSKDGSITFTVHGVLVPHEIERIVTESVDSFHLYATRL